LCHGLRALITGDQAIRRSVTLTARQDRFDSEARSRGVVPGGADLDKRDCWNAGHCAPQAIAVACGREPAPHPLVPGCVPDQLPSAWVVGAVAVVLQLARRDPCHRRRLCVWRPWHYPLLSSPARPSWLALPEMVRAHARNLRFLLFAGYPGALGRGPPP